MTSTSIRMSTGLMTSMTMVTGRIFRVTETFGAQAIERSPGTGTGHPTVMANGDGCRTTVGRGSMPNRGDGPHTTADVGFIIADVGTGPRIADIEDTDRGGGRRSFSLLTSETISVGIRFHMVTTITTTTAGIETGGIADAGTETEIEIETREGIRPRVQTWFAENRLQRRH